MRTLLITLALALLFPLISSAQMSGRVVDSGNGEPLAGVIVTLKRVGEKKIIGYGRSNSSGVFELKVKPAEGQRLHFSLLGFAKDSIRVAPQQGYYEIALREQVTQLKEVKVTAKPIRAAGDTVTYTVSNFSEIQDKKLADVLKKMPGIEVSPTGQIKYQGQSINKFYIEGRDMLGGRYGIATNTINPDDVAAVDVMENHQPIKVLQDISFSQNPAINIRLKENAKSRWVGTIKLGGGYMDSTPSLLWDGQATAMRFKKESQVLVTAQSSNVGKAVTSFSDNLIFDESGALIGGEYSLRDWFAVAPAIPSQLDMERTRKGPTHMVSANNLWGLWEGIDLTSKVNYRRRTDLFKSRGELVYFLHDGNMVIESDEESQGLDQNLSLELGLLVNRPKLYLNNRLTGDFSWNNVDVQTLGTYPNRQLLTGQRQVVDNRLDLIVRRGNGGVSINSFFKWQRNPSQLVVSLTEEELVQRLASQLLFTNTSSSLSYVAGRFVLSTKLGLATMHRQLESELTGWATPATNQLAAYYYQLYATPSISYSQGGFRSEVEAPIAWTSYTFDSGATTRVNNLPIAPRIRMELQANPRLKLSVSARYRNEVLDDQEWYDGYILNNYRLLSLGLEELGRRESGGASLSANYRNVLDAFFASASVGYSRFKASHMIDRDFQGQYMVLRPIAMPTSGDGWTANGRVSKGFMWLKSVLSFNALYSQGSQQMVLQQRLTPYSYDMLMLSGQVTMRPSAWASVLYNLSYQRSGQAMEGEGFERRNNYQQRLNLVFTPSKLWRIELTGNHYYNEIAKELRKHYLLADASLVYSAPEGWEVSLVGRNIFNNRTYGYTSLNSLTQQTSEFDIRPLEVVLGFFFQF